MEALMNWGNSAIFLPSEPMTQVTPELVERTSARLVSIALSRATA